MGSPAKPGSPIGPQIAPTSAARKALRSVRGYRRGPCGNPEIFFAAQPIPKFSLHARTLARSVVNRAMRATQHSEAHGHRHFRLTNPPLRILSSQLCDIADTVSKRYFCRANVSIFDRAICRTIVHQRSCGFSTLRNYSAMHGRRPAPPPFPVSQIRTIACCGMLPAPSVELPILAQQGFEARWHTRCK